jgi:uncharacterized RDD family membrane protein YckC
MNSKFCQKCGNKVLQTMRMCPSCGAKDFDLAPPSTQSSLTQQASVGLMAHSTASSPLSSQSWTTTQGTPHALIPASLWARFFAYLIDTVIVIVATAVPLGLAFSIEQASRSSGVNLIVVIAALFAYGFPFLYYTVMPATTRQATLGKSALGLKLVTISGERLTKMQAFLRVLLTLLVPLGGIMAITLSFSGMALGYKEDLTASFGVAWFLAIPLVLWGPYITAFFNPQKQTLIDMIVKTIVVKN